MRTVCGGELGPNVQLRRFRGFNDPNCNLCLLAILWRSSVSSLAEHWQVTLGPYEKRLRKMLREGDPGSRGEYPAWLCLVTNAGHGGVAAPLQSKYDGHRTYQFQLGRIAVLFAVSSHIQSERVHSLAIGKDGCLGARCLRPRELLHLWKHLNTAAHV
jgi:hypothetical protein